MVVWLCFCGCVFVMMLLWWCGGVFVVVWSCVCGFVCVVVSLWFGFCGGDFVARSIGGERCREVLDRTEAMWCREVLEKKKKGCGVEKCTRRVL